MIDGIPVTGPKRFLAKGHSKQGKLWAERRCLLVDFPMKHSAFWPLDCEFVGCSMIFIIIVGMFSNLWFHFFRWRTSVYKLIWWWWFLSIPSPCITYIYILPGPPGSVLGSLYLCPKRGNHWGSSVRLWSFMGEFFSWDFGVQDLSEDFARGSSFWMYFCFDATIWRFPEKWGTPSSHPFQIGIVPIQHQPF